MPEEALDSHSHRACLLIARTPLCEAIGLGEIERSATFRASAAAHSQIKSAVEASAIVVGVDVANLPPGLHDALKQSNAQQRKQGETGNAHHHAKWQLRVANDGEDDQDHRDDTDHRNRAGRHDFKPGWVGQPKILRTRWPAVDRLELDLLLSSATLFNTYLCLTHDAGCIVGYRDASRKEILIMPSCLIVGATGRVGLPVCNSLIDLGWDVHGCARFTDAPRHDQLVETGANPIEFDISKDDPEALPGVDVVILEVWDPSMIGAEGRYLETMNLNVRDVGRLVQRYAGNADVINGSTVSLYGPRGDRQPRETDPPRPHDDYALSRFAQEWLINTMCEQSGRRAVHLRYCHSNSVDYGFIRRTAELVRDAQSLGNSPDQFVQMISLDDFVRCTVIATVERERMPREVNIVHPRVWTHRELAEYLQSRMGCGNVVFDNEEGGSQNSIWGDPSLMLATFGRPISDIENLIHNVAADVASSRN